MARPAGGAVALTGSGAMVLLLLTGKLFRIVPERASV
jgi:hypothetical protein